MIINIHPDRLNTASGKSGERRLRGDTSASPVMPSRAHVNHIPAPESLRTLIAGAVDALKRGFRWDRGTILNLLV